MSLKNRPKKNKKSANIISVEGSRELEPHVVTHDAPRNSKKPRFRVKSLMLIGISLLVVVILLSVAATIFYNQYKKSQLLTNPTLASEEQVKTLTAEVGKIMLLPTGETPTLATVSDKSKLAGQAFFSNAENGDKVLIYSTAKKAVLYRPSTRKIIEVGPINITSDAGNANGDVAGASASATITPAVARVALLNGTTVVGLTRRVEPSLMSKVPSIEVGVKDNAAKNDYPQTLIIVSSDTQKSVADQIAKALGGKVAPLPSGEVTPPDTDITVILGKNSSE